MPETFKAQITPPEEPTLVDNSIEIQKETTHGEAIKACSAVVTANAGAILSNTVNGIEQRLDEVELVDKDTLVHEIERLKAELNRLFQQVKFATYDIEYGLVNNENHFEGQLAFPGNEFNLLTTLKGISWVLERADFALRRSHKDIDGLKKVIAEAQKRLDDLAQENNSKKEKAQHAGTIKNRKERLKPKKKKHRKLVTAINTMLKTNLGDAEALAASTEKLLIFLVDNGWINPSTTIESTMKLEGPDQQFQIKKIIEEIQEQVPEAVDTPRPDQSERNRLRRARQKQSHNPLETQPEEHDFDELLTPIPPPPPISFNEMLIRNRPKYLILVGALAAVTIFSTGLALQNRTKESISYNFHPSLHKKEKIRTNSDGTIIKLEMFCTAPEHNLSDEDQVPIHVENARREVEFILKDDRPLTQEDFDLSNAKSEKYPKLFKTLNGAPVLMSVKVLDFAQGIDGSEFLRTGEYSDPEGPYNVYQRTMVRTAKVIVAFKGAIKGSYEQTVNVTYKQNFKILQADDTNENH